MKIGILSDTHGWLDSALGTWFAGVDHILHAGDVGNEEILDTLTTIAPTQAVRGNVDGGAWARALPMQYVGVFAGQRIAMLHIAGHPGNINAEARGLIARDRPDVFICGHSHIAVAQRVGPVLWLNPGAAGRQGWHRVRTAFLLTIDEAGKMALDNIELGSRGNTG